ncbi:hypothetical protein DOTSEDRAFT_50432 [Dothistroma septosporum NZE10]|uniref:Glutamine amidotransferase type-2 domain-containing protein n=1 Tax=Dothistroma septosporum (strain NZE10 / CBS 128990) TaxID=675120 RepID=N1Q5H7_DOTSN|nr:hypothetical protein DOTSEDRAFT_50432 [Dothistroma septosporum NZE10]
MCGIFCSISRHKHVQPSASVQTLLEARGPDASNTLLLECCTEPGHETTYVTCHSTVLSLRGSVTTQQPYQGHDASRILCWNGEAWTICGHQPDGNDTASVYNLLKEALSQDVSPMDARDASLTAAQNVSKALSQIAGPYAFVFLDESASRIWLGRDFLGRRSLLYCITEDGNILLSSVTNRHALEDWNEIKADGVYCIDLSQRAYRHDETTTGLHRWGDFFVTKAPYTYKDIERKTGSVLPRLSLCRDVSSFPTTPFDSHSVAVLRLERLLRESLIRRVLDIPEPPTSASTQQRSKLAILFSGGLDCTVLARMCHDLLPTSEPIDLLNVAFQNPRVHKGKGDAAYELCPDRITGRVSHAELQEICSDREWRFVAVDVPYAETQEHRQQVIDLMHPHNTEMDLSISFALYFAARGSGKLIVGGQAENQAYTTSARALLSGLGADELFAGYTRHATAFNRHGFEGLLDELDLDISRLGRRNLGRDDRVISHWSREARFPFLDEKLVGWALTAPVTEKCDFGTDSRVDIDEESCASIEPGKKVLRCLAWKLGMRQVAKEKKRAIQFGARTAKMETGRSKGTTPLSWNA